MSSKTISADTINAAVQSRTLWQDAWRRFRRNKAALASAVVLLLIAAFAIFVPMIAPYAYDHTDWANMSTAPSMATKHYFGTDTLGRDLFVRVASGGRISLMVGVMGALVAISFGTLYGAISGYFGGKVDMVMMRLIEVLSAFPFMFFVILLVTFLDATFCLSFWQSAWCHG